MPPSPASFGFRGAFRDDLPRARRVQRSGGDRADPAARGGRSARRRRRGDARPLGGGDERPARSARLGEQHGRRRDRRRRHRRPEPTRRRAGAGRGIAHHSLRAGRGARRGRSPQRAPSGCSSRSIRRAVRSARSAGWRRRTPPARTRCATARRDRGSKRSTASSPTARAPSCGAARRRRALATRGACARRARTGDRRRAASPSRHAGVRKESSGYGLADVRRVRAISSISSSAARGRSRSSSGSSSGSRRCVRTRRACSAPSRRSRPRSRARTARARMGAVACELLDRTFLDVARRGGAPVPTPEDAESVLLAEVEANTPEEATALIARAIEAEFRAAGATAITLALDRRDRARALGDPPRGEPDPQPSRSRRSRRCSSSRTRCVPPERLPEYVRGVRAALDASRDSRRDLRPRRRRAHAREPARRRSASPIGARASRRLLDEVTALVARLGGTITGEHGDGRLRAPLLPRVWTRATRRALRGGEARVRSRRESSIPA